MGHGRGPVPRPDDQKVAYLQMIEAVIDRMSTSSAIYKGFAAAILAGVAGVAFSDVEWYVLAVLVLPMAGLAALDVRHLRTERAYRALYEEVRIDAHPVDFDLCVTARLTRCEVCRCLQSWSVWMFYGPLFCAWLILTVLRLSGIG